MASSWFVVPDIVRLPLSGGEWVDVKKELNQGEQREMFASMGEHQPTTRVAGTVITRQMIAAYVLGWSLTDADGRPVAFTVGALDGLKAWRFNELWDAVNAHDDRARAAADDEKKTLAGTTPSKTISPSLA
jgi:hypothetical protein